MRLDWSWSLWIEHDTLHQEDAAIPQWRLTHLPVLLFGSACVLASSRCKPLIYLWDLCQTLSIIFNGRAKNRMISLSVEIFFWCCKLRFWHSARPNDKHLLQQNSLWNLTGRHAATARQLVSSQGRELDWYHFVKAVKNIVSDPDRIDGHWIYITLKEPVRGNDWCSFHCNRQLVCADIIFCRRYYCLVVYEFGRLAEWF